MADKTDIHIAITKDGPYIVTGDVPLAIQTIVKNAEGESWEWEQGKEFGLKNVYALCRCGHSRHAPYCDGAHVKVEFDGTETASREPYDSMKTTVDGPAITLDDVRPLCAVAQYCDAVLDSWDATPQTDQPDKRTLVIHQATRCPSGRLVARDTATGAAIEPEFEKSIGVVEDPGEGCSGPLWVRGGIQVRSRDGEPYEVRNRVTLCRCGESKNKPFCDGTHVEVKYHDGIG